MVLCVFVCVCVCLWCGVSDFFFFCRECDFFIVFALHKKCPPFFFFFFFSVFSTTTTTNTNKTKKQKKPPPPKKQPHTMRGVVWFLLFLTLLLHQESWLGEKNSFWGGREGEREREGGGEGGGG